MTSSDRKWSSHGSKVFLHMGGGKATSSMPCAWSMKFQRSEGEKEGNNLAFLSEKKTGRDCRDTRASGKATKKTLRVFGGGGGGGSESWL